MQVPPKNDPRWRRFLNTLNDVRAANLATKMLISRLKVKIAFDPSQAAKDQAIEAAYDFFSRNESAVADDIGQIFK